MLTNVFCMSATALSWDGILCSGCREALEAVIARQKHDLALERVKSDNFEAFENVGQRGSNYQNNDEATEDFADFEDSIADADEWTTPTTDHDESDYHNSDGSEVSDPCDDSDMSEDSENLGDFGGSEDSEDLEGLEDFIEDADDMIKFIHDYASLNRCALLSCRLCAIILALSRKHVGSSSHLSLLNSEIPSNARFVLSGRTDDWDYIMLIVFTYGDSTLGCGPSSETKIEERVHFGKLYGKEMIPNNRSHRIERTLSTIDIASESGVDSQPTLNRSTSSHETLKTLLDWTRLCIDMHEACQRWRDFGKITKSLPTRLLAILPGASRISVKLVLGDMLPNESQYTTLSHCWGGHLPLQLTSSNIDDFKRQIPWEQLPQTFKDAAIVTNTLGIVYLWIDALCIIQDSTSDWIHEASRMALVYANSYLNISADASLNPDGGLFRDRAPVTVESCLVPASLKDSNISGYCCYRHSWVEMVEATSLNCRAWVLQERYLAPRVVRFAADQIYWECCWRLTCEGLPMYFDFETYDTFKASITTDKQRSHHVNGVLTTWTDIIRRYSKARLTNTCDRPLAVAGLARAFCNSVGLEMTDYRCGLWHPTFIHDLIWHCTGFEQSLPIASEVVHTSVPSWSWLSVHHPVSRSYAIYRTIPVAELVEVETTPIGDPFGLVTDGFAKIQGPMCAASVTTRSDGEWLIGVNDEYFGTNLFVYTEERVVYPDRYDESAVLRNYERPKYLLLLGLQGLFFNRVDTDDSSSWPWCKRDEMLLPSDFNPDFSTFLHLHCLILIPTGGRGEFRRIGMMRLICLEPEHVHEFLRIWTALERQFRSYDVPKELYEEVDDRFFYTITLV
jgi:hypothetical protein